MIALYILYIFAYVVVGSFFIGIFSSVVNDVFRAGDETFAMFLVIFWPLVIVGSIVYTIGFAFVKLGASFGNRLKRCLKRKE